MSAELYNAQKKTAYRLPSDISVTISQDSQKIHIQEATDFPKDRKFLVQFPKEFYQNFSSENILWYVYYPAKGETCSEEGGSWNARKYTKTTAMKTETISKNDKNYDIFAVEFNSNTPRQCLLSGFAGDIQLVVDRSLPKFSLEGAVTSMLTPQDDLKTQVQFSSESVIVPESLLNNSDLKKEIFQKIAVSFRATRLIGGRVFILRMKFLEKFLLFPLQKMHMRSKFVVWMSRHFRRFQKFMLIVMRKKLRKRII